MNSFKLAILVLLIPIGFSSCNHEMSVNPKKPSNEVSHFESVNQMQLALSAVLKMTTDEKADWAAQKAFISFGVNADKFYDAIDPDQFKSTGEIVAFINKSKYL